MTQLGRGFASTGFSADFWTAVGLALSVAAGLAYASPLMGLQWYVGVFVGGILLLLSGFFDVVDGSVARVTGKSSKKGAFLDSTFDKVAETAVFVGIAASGLADPVWCIIALATSLLVGYTRARAEALGVELKGVGIGERAERLLIIAIIGMIPHPDAMSWAVVVVSIVASITLGQRILATSRKLPST